MNFQITSGKVPKGKKFVLQGVEGVGKTTLASQFPQPIFIDTEGSTDNYDFIQRYPRPTSWQMLLQEVEHFKQTMPGKTLVIDSADWAERLCIEKVCADNKWDCIEKKDYGKGYVYLAQEFGKFLNSLEFLLDQGVNIVFTAHIQIKNVTNPDTDPYDRYEPNLQKKVSALLKQWADASLFLRFKEYTYKDGSRIRVSGGKQRVMMTTRSAVFDAKNRFSLEEELPLDFSSIAHIFGQTAGQPVQPAPIPAVPVQTPPQTLQAAAQPAPAPATPIASAPTPPATPVQTTPPPTDPQSVPDDFDWSDPVYQTIDQRLVALMKNSNIPEWAVRKTSASKHHFPENTPIASMPPDYIEMLISQWDKITPIALNIMAEEEDLDINRDDLPF